MDHAQGARSIYSCRAVDGMYATGDAMHAGTYADLWQKGRYRVQLTAELPSVLDEVDAALEEAGYRMVDADQYGRAYHHQEDGHCTAELDEAEYEFGPVRLVLSRGDLDETQADAAEGELVHLFVRVHGALRAYGPELLSPARRWIDDHLQQALATRDLWQGPRIVFAGE